MKKLLSCALAAVFALSVVGCEAKKDPPKPSGTSTPAPADTKDPAKK